MAQQKERKAKTTIDGDNLGELPQEITESYGIGVIAQPELSDDDITNLQDSSSEYSSTSQIGGEDGDQAAEQESATGEQSVGGTAPTPDLDMVDELGAAAGIELPDGAILHTTNMLERRDESRWELDPSSAEDYQERPDF
ncbi:DUF6335 family protein [Microcoleus sp. Pol12B5]|uniref:DUF6335 family protein n=1 Tax=Microcoleus sp. Pol12B5 TaxID=3055396 RepID=UPI002FCEC229